MLQMHFFRMFQLLLASDTEYLFCCSGSESEINGWFHALRQTISSLVRCVKGMRSILSFQPAAQAYPSVVDGDSLARRPSLGGKPAATGGASQFAKKSSLRQSVKSRLKSGSRGMRLSNTNAIDNENFRQHRQCIRCWHGRHSDQGLHHRASPAVLPLASVGGNSSRAGNLPT